MMTTQEIVDYYVNLLIQQYINLSKARGTIEAFVTDAVMDQLPNSVNDAFDIDSAVGAQLDILGKYVGQTRINYTLTQLVTLSDSDFRLLIKLAIVQNNSGSSLYEIKKLLNDFFQSTVLVFDFKNMLLGYFLDSNATTQDLAEIFIKQNLLPKPCAVGLSSILYLPSIDNLFGFRTYDLAGYNNSGFNTYSSYETDRHWVQYSDVLSL